MVERHEGWTVAVLILFLVLSGCGKENSNSEFLRLERSYLKPEMVKEGEPIELVLEVISGKKDLEFEVVWLKNGLPIEGISSFELSSFYFDKGDSIWTEVSVVSAGEVVRVLDIGPVVCINSPPAVTHIGISALSSTTLKATADYEDLDGDSVSLVKKWYRNSAPYYNGETLTTTDLQRGDTVFVEVTPSDGEAEGRGAQSGAVIIGNQAPRIVSTPPRIGSDRYVYQIDAEDPDGDALTYSLMRGPNGMEIDRSGSLSWVSEEIADSLYLIEIQVLDGFGGSAVQEFELRVKKGSAF
jgi:hypothetical protein